MLIDYISESLYLDKNYVNSIIASSNYYYYEFEINKKKGGKRRICHPAQELKTLQYWAVNNIFKRLPISDSAYAYIKGKSIKQNANQHRNNKFVLHLDIKSFFEKITKAHLQKVLIDNKTLYSQELENGNYDIQNEIDTISRICLRHNACVIGAVSSPIISNVIMFLIDLKIKEYCDANHFIYTRYADDIYISSKQFIDRKTIEIISKILQEHNFILNETKTCFMSMKKRRTVTGLVLTSTNEVSIGLELKKNIKHMLYNKIVKGQGDSAKILGYLSFLKDIEPQYYDRLFIKYSQYGNVLELIKS